MKKALSFLLCSFATFVYAQNPIIHTQFTADPTARVFNDRIYLYPSHDIVSPIEDLQNWFCMEDYHVYSSDDFVDWTDHGVILTQNKIPWVKPDSYAMWAPDCVEKAGHYYFYFPAAPKSMEKGFAIGVAVAQNPEGPFMALPHPIKGVMGIDPCVLIDDDGNCYLYWSGMGLSVARLNDNMLELASEPVKIMGLPEGFKEGPFVFKKDGIYYLTFPWVRDKTETLAYAVSDSPTGPFEFKGIIMDESPTGCWTNHHSILEKDGEWYLFYHHNDYSPDMDKRRSTRIDRLTFNDDGTINKVIPTLRGVGISDARRPIHPDRYSETSRHNTRLNFIDPTNYFAGWSLLFEKQGAWARYNQVDFGRKPVKDIQARVRNSKECEFSISTADGIQIGNIIASPDKGWHMVSSKDIDSPTGINDLIITLKKGSNAELDWIEFDVLP